MKYFLLMILLIAQMHADTICNVDFQFPDAANEWQLINKSESFKKVKSTTQIYAPLGMDIERLTVHCNDLPTKIDKESLNKAIQVILPGSTVQINIVEEKPQSILFEWEANKNEHENAYGVMRVFYSPVGTTLLTYMTQEKSQFDKVHLSWVNAFKSATLK